MHWAIERWVSHFRLRRAALRFAQQGWSVTPGAWLESPGDSVPLRFRCGRPGCVTSSCHPALVHWDDDATTDPSRVEEWWQDAPYSLLLATGHGIEVIEVPALLGARAVCGPVTGPGRPSVTGALRGPVAITPQDRWMFFVRTAAFGRPSGRRKHAAWTAGAGPDSADGHLRPELERREDILRHASGSWVPLPPTRLRSGPVRWEVSPDDVEWRLPTSAQAQRALIAAMVALDASLLDSRHARTVTPAAHATPAPAFPVAERRSTRGPARSTAHSSVEVLRHAA